MDNSMPVSNSNFNGNCLDSSDLMNQNQLNGTQSGIPSPYTFPAILHYLQYEWQKLEQEKQQWVTEKAELQAQLAILEGRVMSQFNLKKDLIRRIKMLEYCLRAERAKYHKLKYGVEPPPLHVQEDDEFKNELSNENTNPEITTNTNWKKGRHLLRQYLMEIGYTDAIINIRSSRVRYLLGLNNEDEVNENNQNANNLDSSKSIGDEKKGKKFISQPNAFLASEAEQSVDATIAFLKEQSNSMQNDDQDDDDNDNDVMDSETEEVLSEFNFLSAHQSNNTTVLNTNTMATNSKNLDIGELANITPTNDERVDTTTQLKEWSPRFVLKSHFDCVRCLKFHDTLVVTGSEDETIKLWNLNKVPLASNKNKATQDLEPIYTYRGHKSPVLSLLVINNRIYSGGLNGEILVWKIPFAYNSIDPYDSYDPSLQVGNLEGHTDAVWSLVGIPNDDPSTPADEDVVDAVVDSFPNSDLGISNINLICSASADATIKVWNLKKLKCIKTIVCDENLGKPTCLAALPSNATLDSSASNINSSTVKSTDSTSSSTSSQYLAVSFTKGSILIYDLNSTNFSQPVLVFESSKLQHRVNAIIVHPTLTVIVTAHEDQNLRFWDYTTGKCIHEMVAHQSEITSLDIDSEGLYLLSGAHDCSVRLWNFESRRCIKETKSHIEKFSEAILDVSFHPTQKYFGTAGADSRAKIYCNSESK